MILDKLLLSESQFSKVIEFLWYAQPAMFFPESEDE